MEKCALASEIISISKGKIIVWGYQKLQKRLEEDFLFFNFSNYVIFLNEKTEYIPVGITIRELHGSCIDSDSVVVITHINEAVNDFISQNNHIRVIMYCPENNMEEKRMRIYSKGIFNGREYIQLKRGEEANKILVEFINGDSPFLYSRWGEVEARGFWAYKIGKNLDQSKEKLKTNAGVYPNTDKMLEIFANEMEKAARCIDIFCTFPFYSIDSLYERYSVNSIAISSELEYPFEYKIPWTYALQGRKVLVIHPFSKLIQKQYDIRSMIWDNNKVLPEFDLITFKAVQSIGGCDEYTDWYQALKYMQKEISKKDFDVALIGCGAYGMPLGAYIKAELGKKAIHIGGSLQVLFGIKGSRWEGKPYFYDERFYNDFWVRPYESDKPQNWSQVENGCYW